MCSLDCRKPKSHWEQIARAASSVWRFARSQVGLAFTAGFFPSHTCLYSFGVIWLCSSFISTVNLINFHCMVFFVSYLYPNYFGGVRLCRWLENFCSLFFFFVCWWLNFCLALLSVLALSRDHSLLHFDGFFGEESIHSVELRNASL